MKKLLILSLIVFSIPISSLELTSCYSVKDEFQKFPIEIKTGSAEDVFEQIFTYLSTKAKRNISYKELESDKFVKARLTIVNLNKDAKLQNISNYNDITNIASKTYLLIYINVKWFDSNFNYDEWTTKLYSTIVK